MLNLEIAFRSLRKGAATGIDGIDSACFYKVLPAREKKYGLELAKEKARKIMFIRPRKEDSESFEEF
ncbi:hypothetical protein CHISP_3674 [Chitinispirillum alkaliphilum]|nr:hypothetical protein CHISP_3674 [Chitinispirillum alkaliphilum]